MNLAHLIVWPLAALAPAAAALARELPDAPPPPDAEAEQALPVLFIPEIGSMIFNLVVFLLLLLVLGKFVWPHILHGLNAREDKIRTEIESVEAANAEAKATLEKYQQQLAEAHAETRRLIDQARVDGEALRQRIVADAEGEIAEHRRRATDEINHARQVALQDLYAHSAELAVAVASKILQRQITEADTARLVEESLNEMGRLHRAG